MRQSKLNTQGLCKKQLSSYHIFRLLCETPDLSSGAYARFWSPLLQALVGLFELPEDDSIPDDEHFIDIEDTPGYQVTSRGCLWLSSKLISGSLNLKGKYHIWPTICSYWFGVWKIAAYTEKADSLQVKHVEAEC